MISLGKRGFCHPREGGLAAEYWIPVFAGMTSVFVA